MKIPSSMYSPFCPHLACVPPVLHEKLSLLSNFFGLSFYISTYSRLLWWVFKKSCLKVFILNFLPTLLLALDYCAWQMRLIDSVHGEMFAQLMLPIQFHKLFFVRKTHTHITTHTHYTGQQTKNLCKQRKFWQRKFFAKKRMQRKQRKILALKP